jgi:hypothetical protein
MCLMYLTILTNLVFAKIHSCALQVVVLGRATKTTLVCQRRSPSGTTSTVDERGKV